MSAIAGFWDRGAGLEPAASCARMLAAQAIYGPDHGAQWSDPQVALGRRLYRLLPEDAHDRQPLSLADGRILVADLRLDNRAELETALDIAPGLAAGLSDAAVLRAAWERWAEATFEHLVGDYAFALWDGAAARLILARDPHGARPLHFHAGQGFFAFASMPKGLHGLAPIPKGPDEAHLAAFVALAPETGPRSFFRGISRVEPGAVVSLSDQGLTSRSHWTPRRRATPSDMEACAALLRTHLDQAVAARLRGAGQTVGAHLSSGWDSSAVAATAARLLAGAGREVASFTAAPRAGYDGPAPKGCHTDEAPLAREVAALYPNMAHVVARTPARSPLETADRDVYVNDRPMLNLCNKVWLDEVCRTARARGVRVMLTGDFGNLTLSDDGLDHLADLIGTGRWGRWLGHARRLNGAGGMRWSTILAVSFEDLAPVWLWNLLRRITGRRAERLADYVAMRPSRLAATLAAEPRPRDGGRVARRLAALARLDPGAYGKGVLATWGVDLRDPLTDRRLMEFCLSIRPELRLAGGAPRALARAALSDRLPAAVLDAPTRGYQGADWHEAATAARSELSQEVERLAGCAPVAALLDIDRLRRLLRDWPARGWEQDKVMVPYRLALLRAISAGRFMRLTLGHNG